MQALDVASIVTAGVPVMCTDTCSVLDLMRDPTRDDASAQHRNSAVSLVDRMESGDLICLIAQQVQHEFAEHDSEIQAEASRTIAKLRERVERANEIHQAFLPRVAVDLTHLDALVGASRLMVGRWLAASKYVTPTADVLTRAWDRVNRNVSPSRKGKDSIKDCVVFETYLEAMDDLRSAGLTSTAVFLSSNWREYLGDGKVLKPDLVADFGRAGMSYAPHPSLAKVQLGF